MLLNNRWAAIHTYLELFGRYFIDLTPNVALIVAQAADAAGNLYLGPNTEETPAIVEATAFKSGIVIAQVNEVLDQLPRLDLRKSVRYWIGKLLCIAWSRYDQMLCLKLARVMRYQKCSWK